MATRMLSASIINTSKQYIASLFSRSYASHSMKPPSSSVSRLRHISAVVNFTRMSPVLSTFQYFTTRQATSSLTDEILVEWPTPLPKETFISDGCDYKHWLVRTHKPEGEPSRDEIIDFYVKILATVIGSEEEARMKIYSVSTRHWYSFGAFISEELSYKLKDLDKVRCVLPDSYVDVERKEYGGESFSDGKPSPYDPIYGWLRDNTSYAPLDFEIARNIEREEKMKRNQKVHGSNDRGEVRKVWMERYLT